MANVTIFFLLGIAICVLAGTMLLPAAYAFATGELEAALSFGVTSLITAFVGGALVVATRGRVRPVSRFQTVVFALIIWSALPFFAAIPFLAEPMNLTLISALFEAVSAFTTTGVTSTPLNKFPLSYVLWFALLQWLGGFASLVTVFTIIAPSGLCGSLTQVAIPGTDQDDFVQSVKTTIFALIPAYGVFTLVCLILLWVAGIPFFDALSLSLTTLSTGGFVPQSEGLSFYNNSMAELVLMIFMVVGATSALTHRNLIVTRSLRVFENRESNYVIAMCLVVGALLSLWQFFAGEGEVVAALKTGFFAAISLVTTTGYQVSSSDMPVAPYGLIIAVVFVGGATFSTAGGMKLYRLALIIKQSTRELTRILHPHGITAMRAGGREYDIQMMKSIWALFVVYLALVAVTALALGLMGIKFDLAFLTSVAMLSNAGPAVTAGLGEEGLLLFSSATGGVKLILIPVMILGRVEILVLLSLGNLVYWRS